MLHKWKHPVLLTLVTLLALLLALPVAAQEGEEEGEGDEPETVVVMGYAEFDEDGSLLVDGYLIILDDETEYDFEAGDFVIIVGVPDAEDDTIIYALSVEIGDPADFEDPEDGEEEPVDEEGPVDEEEEEEEPANAACQRENHPAGLRIAANFGVEYEEVMALFCQGYGFGEIMIALTLAQATDQPLEDILALRESGLGWGQVMRESGAHPADLAPGRVRGRGPWGDDFTPEEGEETTEQTRPGRRSNADRPGGPPEDRPGGPPPGRGQGNGNGGQGNGNGNGNGGQGGRGGGSGGGGRPGGGGGRPGG